MPEINLSQFSSPRLSPLTGCLTMKGWRDEIFMVSNKQLLLLLILIVLIKILITYMVYKVSYNKSTKNNLNYLSVGIRDSNRKLLEARI